jgi:hypothetical protein
VDSNTRSFPVSGEVGRTVNNASAHFEGWVMIFAGGSFGGHASWPPQCLRDRRTRFLLPMLLMLRAAERLSRLSKL